MDDSTTSLTERVTDLETGLTEEENARTAADTELSGGISDLQTALAAETQTREEADEDIETALENKAEKDGYYPNLYAGNLASTRKQTDSVPYLMRKTGGDLSRVGEREDDTLVGATVNVNQLMLISSTSRSATIQGVTFVDNRDGSYTFYTGENGASATATFRIISKIDGGSPQHVHYLKGNAEGSSISTWYLTDQYNGVFNYDFKKENIVKVLMDTPVRLDLRVVVASGTVISAPVTIKPQVIDLTAYFGSTIADYLYSLESATAGAGIAKLKEWGFFTEDYIPYNPGTLESVEATAHVMRDADENIIGNYNLGTDTLRGLFKLDSNNNLYADGDRKASDGTVTRKYGVVDLGTLTWTHHSSNGVMYAPFSGNSVRAGGNYGYPFVCTKYAYGANVQTLWSGEGEGLCVAPEAISSTIRIYVRDANYTDTATFKTAMSGVMLVYELATPTTEQSTPFTSPQICDPDGTEEYVTSNGVPVGHETEYDYDIKGLAEGLIDVPDVPSTNGTYVLKATRTADGLTYNWVAG